MQAAKIYLTPLYIWSGIALLGVLHIIWFTARIMAAPPTIQVQYIPDDAFYYLVLARNFSNLGVWTFDGGLSITSGFHPLHAYILSAVYYVTHPSNDQFVVYGLLVGLLINVAVLFWLWQYGVRQQNTYFMIAFALVVFSRNFVFNAVSIMEWTLVVTCACFYYWSFSAGYRRSDRRSYSILFLLGLLGSLSRTDFGLLPLSLFIASIIVCYVIRATRPILLAAAGLVGAVIGVLLSFAHNYIFTGNVLQSSARMKSYWSQIEGTFFGSAASLVPSVIGISPGDTLLKLGMILLAVLLAVLILRRSRQASGDHFGVRAESGSAVVLALSSVLCVAGYVVVYAYNGAVQNWYTANLIAPVGIGLIIFAWTLEQLLQSQQRVTQLFSVFSLVLLVYNVSVLYPVGDNASPYSHQAFLLDAANYLRNNPPQERVGAWNAGIIGYYKGGNVVNLDGLVNDDIYVYARSNQLPSYMLENNISFVVDFKNMLVNEQYRRRGGYDDSRFLASLQSIVIFDQGERPPWQYLTLYRIAN